MSMAVGLEMGKKDMIEGRVSTPALYSVCLLDGFCSAAGLFARPAVFRDEVQVKIRMTFSYRRRQRSGSLTGMLHRRQTR